jgi:hypothetical protein
LGNVRPRAVSRLLKVGCYHGWETIANPVAISCELRSIYFCGFEVCVFAAVLGHINQTNQTNIRVHTITVRLDVSSTFITPTHRYHINLSSHHHNDTMDPDMDPTHISQPPAAGKIQHQVDPGPDVDPDLHDITAAAQAAETEILEAIEKDREEEERRLKQQQKKEGCGCGCKAGGECGCAGCGCGGGKC